MAGSDNWQLLGDSLIGDNSNANLGFSISSNDDGNIIAVSAPNDNDGIVKVFKINPSTANWEQYGQTLTSSFSDSFQDQLFGFSVDLNSDGTGVKLYQV